MSAAALPRVLFVAQRIPEPVRGGLDLRNLGVLHALTKTTRVTGVSLTGRDRRVGSTQWFGLEALIGVSARSLIGEGSASVVDPFQSFRTDSVVDRLRELVESVSPDLVVMSRSQSWVFASVIREVVGCPIVLDLDEMAGSVARSLREVSSRRAVSPLHVRFLAAVGRYEERILGEPDRIWVSSRLEAQRIRGSLKRDVIDVVPNSVAVRPMPTRDLTTRAPRVVFPANFAYPPNVAAAEEILASIAPSMPAVRFELVGSRIPEWLRRHEEANVDVIGPVDDMRGLIGSAHAAVLPIRAGGGTRLKALECMEAGVPVVGTRFAFEGLDVDDGVHVLCGESPDELVTALERVLVDEGLVGELTTNSRNHVERYHSWQSAENAVTTSLGRLF
jgi:glycosyltransferase involved in cell wall biosynthesis